MKPVIELKFYINLLIAQFNYYVVKESKVSDVSFVGCYFFMEKLGKETVDGWKVH